MSVMTTCQDVRNNFSIKEVPCPKCGDVMELFVRDGKTVGRERCDRCGALIDEGILLSDVFRGKNGN